jgi:hypothetical protein
LGKDGYTAAGLVIGLAIVVPPEVYEYGEHAVGGASYP